MNMPKRHYAPEARLLLLATAFLCLGVLVYALDRGDPAYFLPQWLSAGPVLETGLLGDSLPAFTHTLAMILVTAAVLWPWPGSLPANCAGWMAVEWVFEVGQASPIDQGIAAALPGWFEQVPLLDAAGDYFLSGTFDLLDLLASLLGAFLAYLIVHRIYQGAEP